jgi:hypothetical protein
MGSLGSVFTYKNHPNSNFTFEDELFLGPVYKRLLISKLCEQPASHSRSKRTPCVPTTGPEPIEASLDQARDRQAHYEDDALALELRQQGLFSRSCHEDYLEFMERPRPRRMQRRHLPLASVLCQQDRSSQDQERINQFFLDAGFRRDLGDIAKALDDGADINARSRTWTALEICIMHWTYSIAAPPDVPCKNTTCAEFLLLYKETQVPYLFPGSLGRLSILHFCMHVGATAELMQPLFDVEGKLDALQQLDKSGHSVLHTAVLSSDSGLFALKQLKQLLGDVVVQPEDVVDKRGVNARKFALSRGAFEHVAILEELAGREPGNINELKLVEGLHTENLPPTSPINSALPGTKDDTSSTSSREAS